MHRSICWTLLAILLAMPLAVNAAQGVTGQLNGKLLYKQGEPVTGGKVLFFSTASGPPPAQGRYWRVPESFAEIATDGAFSAKLPPGSYYLGAISRSAGKQVGPPEEGVITFLSRDDNSSLKVFTVTANQTADIGLITVTPPSTKTVPASEITAIAGKVLNAEGKPVAGSLVFAYPGKEMRGRAQFISARTGSDGSYLLRVNVGGSYYLKARSSTGKRLVDGENIGSYGGNVPQPVIVATGQTVTGIDIQGKNFSRENLKQNKSRVPEPRTDQK